MKPLRHRMLAKIHALAHELTINSDTLNDYCSEWTGVKPVVGTDNKPHLLSKLTLPQLEICIQNLVKAQTLLKDNIRKFDGAGKPVVKVQKAQISKMAKLGFLLKWDTTTIRRFIHRQTHKNDWNHLTLDEASKVIVGMEAIMSHGKKSRKPKGNWNVYE